MCYCGMRCLIPIPTDMAKNILLGRRYDEPHLFKVRWNDHLVSYFSLMYCYGINTNILHLTFSLAGFSSFRIKC